MAKKPNILDVRIDPEFESLIDPLTDEEYQQLKENIRKYGLQDKIKYWVAMEKRGNVYCPLGYNVIVDGHNRHKIINELAEEEPGSWSPYDPDDYDPVEGLSTREQVKEYIIKNQLGRRNLTPFQRTELALKLKPAIVEKAKKNQSTHTLDGYQGLENSSKAVDTRQVIATVADVSTDTVRKVEKILEKASEENKDKLRKGTMSINKVFKVISGNEKKEPMHFIVPSPETTETKKKQHPFDPAILQKQKEEEKKYRLVKIEENKVERRPLVFIRNNEERKTVKIPEKQIERLLKEASDSIKPLELYDECVKRYVDETAMFNAEGLTATDIAINFALAGYKLGIETALRNIDLKIGEESDIAENS